MGPHYLGESENKIYIQTKDSTVSELTLPVFLDLIEELDIRYQPKQLPFNIHPFSENNLLESEPTGSLVSILIFGETRSRCSEFRSNSRNFQDTSSLHLDLTHENLEILSSPLKNVLTTWDSAFHKVSSAFRVSQRSRTLCQIIIVRKGSPLIDDLSRTKINLQDLSFDLSQSLTSGSKDLTINFERH